MSSFIDITTTATIRPYILRQTLESFDEYMLAGVNCRHIINIDPIGDNSYTYWNVLGASSRYFKDICCNLPSHPNFAKAFIWCWRQVEADYFLHLEDDWLLLREIDLLEMIKVMTTIEDLAILRLPFTDAKEKEALQWNRYFPFNGLFMECPEELKGGIAYSGHPSLIKKKWLDEVLPLLTPGGCPEKQIKGHNPAMMDILSRWRYGVWQKPNEPKAIVDNGRVWREKFGFIKNGAYGFTNWKKENGKTDTNA